MSKNIKLWNKKYENQDESVNNLNQLNHNSERTFDSIERKRETWKG